MKRTVTVTGTGAVAVVPDRATLRLGSSCRAASVGEAVAGLAEVAERVHQVARAATAPRHVQTTGLQVWPRHDEHGNPVGVEASQQLAVRCPDLDSASQLLTDVSVVAGENLRVDGLDLEVSDSTQAVVQARELAFADARSRAEHLAALSGATLVEVRSVVEGGGVRGAHPVAERVAYAASMPIAPGERTVESSVQVTWSLG